MEKHPAATRSLLLSICGRKWRSQFPNEDFLIRLGSAARAKNGKIDETPTICRKELKNIVSNTTASFNLPKGNASFKHPKQI
jgi:hypothetical protein